MNTKTPLRAHTLLCPTIASEVVSEHTEDYLRTSPWDFPNLFVDPGSWGLTLRVEENQDADRFPWQLSTLPMQMESQRDSSTARAGVAEGTPQKKKCLQRNFNGA